MLVCRAGDPAISRPRCLRRAYSQSTNILPRMQTGGEKVSSGWIESAVRTAKRMARLPDAANSTPVITLLLPLGTRHHGSSVALRPRFAKKSRAPPTIAIKRHRRKA